MTEQGWDSAEYRCGRCGYHFTATSQDEYARLFGEHRGNRCLAIIGRLTPDQIDYLANDLERIASAIPRCNLRMLLNVLHDSAKGLRERTDSPEEGASGESDE